jgi:hypothetical protein
VIVVSGVVTFGTSVLSAMALWPSPVVRAKAATSSRFLSLSIRLTPSRVMFQDRRDWRSQTIQHWRGERAIKKQYSDKNIGPFYLRY